MHRLFQVDELLRRICRQLSVEGSASLASMACVRKDISTIALDILWEEIFFGTILFLLPADAVKHVPSGVNSLESLARPLPRKTLLRVTSYTRRVKVLKWRSTTTTPTSGASEAESAKIQYYPGSILHSIGMYRHSEALFPNLQRLTYSPRSFHELLGLPLVMGSALTSFDLKIEDTFDLSLAPFDQASYQEAVDNPLWFLLDLEPQLEILRVIPVPPNATLHNSYRVPLLSLISRNILLVNVAIVPSPELLEVLGTLPNLHSLELHVRTWHGEPISSVHPTKPHVPFSALITLTVHAASLSTITSLLTGHNCFARTAITIKCVECPTAQDFHSFIKIILHPEISTDLQAFRLSSSGSSMQWEGDFPFLTTLEMFHPLLRCANLQVFVHDTGVPMHLEDADLQIIASSWPKITALDLGSRVLFPEFSRRLTLRGIAHLSVCTMLETLKLVLIITEDPTELLLTHESSTRCPLTYMVVGSSPISEGFTVVMACFLTYNFPDLNRIDFERGEPYESRWSEIEHGLKGVRKLVDILTSSAGRQPGAINNSIMVT
ncbi:hypothetical protein BU17DRAFT_90917 [Hysterangium stoloniferum]|nr:hypothetical protein BU17DRAFT_90917 [Hysterangium stoloniferum]